MNESWPTTGQPTVDAPPRDLFLDSLARCQENERFLYRFYDRFLNSSDEIKNRFLSTDFAVQTRMLAGSLRLCALAIEGKPAGLRELNERARTHDRQHHNVPPPLYTLWLDSLVATAAETDAQWSDEIAAAWCHELGFVIKHMQKRY